MTEEQKLFMRDTLPQFIVREQGAAFAMEEWLLDDSDSGIEPNKTITLDGILRTIPTCGTVSCIGGSVELLLGMRTERPVSHTLLAERMGLSYQESDALFYGWMGPADDEVGEYAWPQSFAERYEEADTTLEKAVVAAELCVLVAETDGKCLHVPHVT